MEEIKKSFYEMTTSENANKEYFQVGQKFIEELFFLLTKYCTKFYNNKYFFDLPYIYSERLFNFFHIIDSCQFKFILIY